MATEESEELKAQVNDLMFGVRRSVRYHNRRRGFFDRLNLIGSALSVMFGSVAIGGMLKSSFATLGLIAGGLVTIISAINLVVGSTRMARLHADLAKKFIQLERDIVAVDNMDEASLKRLLATRLEIEAEEPPALRVLDCLCHNELARAMGYDKADMVKVGWFQGLCAQIIDIRAAKIE